MTSCAICGSPYENPHTVGGDNKYSLCLDCYENFRQTEDDNYFCLKCHKNNRLNISGISSKLYVEKLAQTKGLCPECFTPWQFEH